MAKTILIVEDEPSIVEILRFNLEREGFQVLATYDGRAGLAAALEKNPDLILLDIMLPYMDGFEVCREFRKTNNLTPVIMLTAREEEEDKVFGLELGADDYISKPFSVREVIARVKTNLRRGAADLPQAASAAEEARGLRFGELLIDLEKHLVFKNGSPLDLTAREYDLLAFLAQSPGKVFSREELMTGVWNFTYIGDDLRTVDVAVRRLREKLEDNSAEPKYLLTRRGMGYYLNA